MSGHTPGPWAYNRFFGIQENSRGVLGKTICEVQYPPLPSEEHEANGRLIAAAPDLLEALKDMTFDEYGAPTCWPNQERVLALIAKAEGR